MGTRISCWKDRHRNFAFLVFALLLSTLPAQAVGVINAWTNATSSYWEFQTNWSLGQLPDQTQSVYITNSGWKAVAIGTNAAQHFPQSMQLQDLQIASPVDSFNVFLMNFSGFQVPLQTTSLTVGSNSAVVVQSSSLEAGSITLYGTFSQSDFSQVKVDGLMQMGPFGGGGAYYLTNGTLSVNSSLLMGGFGPTSIFIQYSGANNVGALRLNIEAEYDIYNGQLTATNGITVGSGDFADAASFNQYGGNVNADTAINGYYNLNGGTITGRMSVPSGTEFHRVDAFVAQNGGTNFAVSLDVGHPNRYGGRGFYVLSNGVLHVDSSAAFNGAQFSQYNGLNTIVSNLDMQGTLLPGLGIDTSDYLLAGGTLSAGGITALNATFQQNGGSNLVAGALVLSAADSPQYDRYTLAGGFLSARNVIINATYYGGFHQTGGSNQISEQLTVQGVSTGAFSYTLEGGTLTVKDIYVASGAFFKHTSGNIIQSGLLTLNHGYWYVAPGNQALGPLRLDVGQDNSSAITFPGTSCTLRLAKSSAQPWASSAILYIHFWQGSTSGGGATQLYFGSDSSGLTPQQLAQIRFNVSGYLYPAKILATGELVPVAPPRLEFIRNGGTLGLHWGPGWVLQSATNVTGPYNDVSGAASPWPVAMTSPQQFFRLRQ